MTVQEHKEEYKKKMLSNPTPGKSMLGQVLGCFQPEERADITIDQVVAMLIYYIYGNDLDINDMDDVVDKSYPIHCDVEDWVHRYVRTAKSLR